MGIHGRPISAVAILVLSLCGVGCATGQRATGVIDLRSSELVDLTHAFDADTIYWPTEEGFVHEIEFAGETPGGWYYESSRFRSAEHGGTHLDAPVHFHRGGQSVESIPLERLIGAGVVVNVEASCAQDRDHQVTVVELEEWESRNGRIPDGAIVLLRTGFAAYWPDRERYMGTAKRGTEGVAALHFPGLSAEAARWLADERKIAAVGLDTPSIDRGISKRFEAHQVLAARDIPVFENVASLAALPARDFHVLALPMKIRAGSGGPLRIVAVVPGR